MATVSNQLPYTELKPLPFPREVCPALKKIITRVTLVMTMVAFFIGAGISLGISNWLVSIWTGAIAGGILGLITGIVFAALFHIPTAKVQYRLGTLDQIEKTQPNPTMLSILKKLKEFLAAPLTKFYQTYENHALHNQVTFVTEHLDPQRDDLQKVWKNFITHLHGTKMLNADGNPIELDFSLDLERLENKPIQVDPAEWLDPKSETYEKDLEQIEELEWESFGKVGTFSKEKLKEVLQYHPQNAAVVIRREKSPEVLGFAWLFMQEEGLCLAGMARKAKATHLKIGDLLFEAIFQKYPVGQPIHLHVRESNPAIRLYEKWGFVKEKEIPKYVIDPVENAYLMKLDWEKLKENIDQAKKEKAS